MHFRTVQPDEYRLLYDHMERDFPANERPRYRMYKGLLDRGVYHGYFAVDEQGMDVGYTIVSRPEGYDYALVVFLAILPAYRSHGYGGQLLDVLNQTYPDCILVLEVEDPSAARDEADKVTRERRIRLYERNGYQLVPIDHYRLFGVQMLVMMNRGALPRDVRTIIHTFYRLSVPFRFMLRWVNIKNTN